MAVKATEENFSSEVLENKGITIADFYSDSCIPCKRISPVLSEIEAENPDIRLVKVNINFNAGLAEKYKVHSIPELIFFVDGKEADRTGGAVGKADIISIIDKLR